MMGSLLCCAPGGGEDIVNQRIRIFDSRVKGARDVRVGWKCGGLGRIKGCSLELFVLHRGKALRN